MCKIILLFIMIWIYKYSINNSKRKNTIKYFDEYKSYVTGLSTNNYNGDIRQHTNEIRRLISNTTDSNPIFSTSEPIGYGQIRNANFSTLDNMFLNDTRVISNMFNLFEVAIGEYEFRRKQCFDITYWINTAIFLPSNLFKYLGLNSDSIFAKIFNIIWWFIAFLLGLYQSEIKLFIENNFSNFFK